MRSSDAASALDPAAAQAVRAFAADNVGRDRGLRALLEAVGVLAVMHALAPPLAGPLAGVLVVCAAAAAAYTRVALAAFVEDGAAVAAAGAAAAEVFGNVKTVRAYNREALEEERFGRQAERCLEAGLKLSRTKARP